jgi:hypothetical protein
VKSPVVVHGLLSEEDRLRIKAAIGEPAQLEYSQGFGRYVGSDRSFPILKELAVKLTAKAREVFGSKTLLPTYSLFAHYQGSEAKLHKHKDSNACTYTLDLCLYQKQPWALWVEGQSYILEENQALAYYGEGQVHWREKFPDPENNHVAMIFFHFAEPSHWFFTKGPSYVDVFRKEVTEKEWEESNMPTLTTPRSAYVGTTVLNVDPMVAVVKNFIDKSICDQVVNIAKNRISRAEVSVDEGPAIFPGRSGFNCWIPYSDHPVIQEIGERVSSVVGIPLSHAESLQVIHYDPEQEYKDHYDAYDLSTICGQRCCKWGHQRVVTALLYLNEVEEGGSTDFPKINLSVVAETGKLLIFNNIGDNITVPHKNSLHAGRPVVRGEKWACNIWFRARPMKELQSFTLLHSS